MEYARNDEEPYKYLVDCHCSNHPLHKLNICQRESYQMPEVVCIAVIEEKGDRISCLHVTVRTLQFDGPSSDISGACLM